MFSNLHNIAASGASSSELSISLKELSWSGGGEYSY